MTPFELARYWPDRVTHLLLKAAFHPDVEVAQRAWQRWQHRCDFDKSFWSDLRVALKAFVRFRGSNTNSKLEPRLRGLHRYIWSAGQMRVDAARPLLQRLADEGVTLMPIKGSVLLARDPRAMSTRFIADLDLLVAPACWERAVDISLAEGWKNEWNLTRDAAVHRIRQTHHALSLQRGPHGAVDLHISSLLLNRQLGADEKLWLRVGRGSLCGIPVLLPHPSDQLAIVFGHCFLFRPSKSVDWVDDALATIAAPGFDWGIFVEFGVRA